MENRIEIKMKQLKQNEKKAFITYMTAGLPDLEGCKRFIRILEGAGSDIIELGIPFSDPTADGPVIQEASYRAIQKGVSIAKVFGLVEEIRREGVEIPIVFMLYYNTIYHFGLQQFTDACIRVGVDGLIVPDLPLEEQGEFKEYLEKEGAPILIQLVSPVSGERVAGIVQGARGFLYCVSGMGVTGQGGSFHPKIVQYLTEVKKQSPIPVMMGFGIQTARDVEPVRHIVDGAIVGTHFIRLLEESGYDENVAESYCRSFRQELNKE